MCNEKQQKIVEMAKDICRYQPCCNDVCKPISACDALRYAERAVEAGYVKVVRCKECEYAERERMCDHDEIFCKALGLFMHEQGFCSYAKMKGADNE